MGDNFQYEAITARSEGSLHFKRTKKGTVASSISEVYLRTDIPCHSPQCSNGCVNGELH